VDDTFTIMPNKTSANNFLETLNQCHSSIKFTMEIENNRMLPFLGTRLLNKSTHVDTKVYVKPTNSGLLHYKSHVEDRYKRGLLNTMLNRRFDFLLTGPTPLKNAIVSSCCSPVLNTQRS